ncbi:MAG: hypothetical protein ACNA7Y_02250 [Gammaproteobacteria bacterium]
MKEDDLSFWQKFEASLNPEYLTELTAIAGEKSIRYEEFYYLLSRYPYLDLQHSAGSQPLAERPLRILSVKGGWDIQDFGDRIRTSPGRFLYGGYRVRHSQDDEEGESTGGVIQPQGALTQQMIDMAEEMIALAMEKGWPEVDVVGGFYGMIRAAWVAAAIQDYKIVGFEPSENDAVVEVWVRRLLDKKKQKLKVRREQLLAKEGPASRLD